MRHNIPKLGQIVALCRSDFLEALAGKTQAILDEAETGSKDILEAPDADKIKINTESNPVLMRYYRSGSWGVY